MNDTIRRINEFYDIKNLDESSLLLLSSYEKEGEYRLTSDEEMMKMDMDLRWDCSIHATYYALVLLLKYYNEGHESVYEQLMLCLHKSLDYGFVYEGYTF